VEYADSNGRKRSPIQPGYPPLFRANSIATKVLVDVASAEPLHGTDIAALQAVSNVRSSVLLRKLVIGGLLERLVLETRPSGYHYRLSDIEPLATPVRAVVASLGAANGLVVPGHTPQPEKARRIDVAPTDDQGDRHGIHYGLLWILGTPLRTLAIVIVAILGEADENTVARACAVTTDKSMPALLKPIQRDGIFVTSTVGRFKMCAIPDAAWKPSLESLARTIARVDPNAGALVEAARQIRTGGTWHGRKFLERYLRDGRASYKDPGRKSRDGE